jgi:hypothetical protein
MFLIFGGEDELIVKGYTDASFQTDKDDSASQSGFVFYLNGRVVSWKSSKQDTVADSTTEAEYIATSEAAKEAVWIRKFVSELGVVQVHPVQWTSIVIIVVPLRLQRSLDHTRSPDIYYGSITSSVTLLRKVM